MITAGTARENAAFRKLPAPMPQPRLAARICRGCNWLRAAAALR